MRMCKHYFKPVQEPAFVRPVTQKPEVPAKEIKDYSITLISSPVYRFVMGLSAGIDLSILSKKELKLDFTSSDTVPKNFI